MGIRSYIGRRLHAALGEANRTHGVTETFGRDFSEKVLRFLWFENVDIFLTLAVRVQHVTC